MGETKNYDYITTAQIWRSTLDKLDKYQKSKKLRTRDDAINSLLEK